MKKQEFLRSMKRRLSGLPREEVEERLGFYSEMIDDRMEEGLTEAEAIADIVADDELAAELRGGSEPLSGSATVRPRRRRSALLIVLLVLGSPIWLSLAVAAVAITVSVLAVIWSVTVAMWAVFASLVGCAVGGAISGAVLAINGQVLSGVAAVGAGLLCGGLAILAFMGSVATTRGVVFMTKKTALAIRRCFG